MVQFPVTWKNHISQLMKTICSGAGVQKRYRNHSLHATGATRLFQRGTPENVIMERSGHRSTDRVWQYQQVSYDQLIAAQAILTAREGLKVYDAERQLVQKHKKAIKESPTKSARNPLAENMPQHPMSQTDYAKCFLILHRRKTSCFCWFHRRMMAKSLFIYAFQIAASISKPGFDLC